MVLVTAGRGGPTALRRFAQVLRLRLVGSLRTPGRVRARPGLDLADDRPLVAAAVKEDEELVLWRQRRRVRGRDTSGEEGSSRGHHRGSTGELANHRNLPIPGRLLPAGSPGDRNVAAWLRE